MKGGTEFEPEILVSAIFIEGTNKEIWEGYLRASTVDPPDHHDYESDE